MRFLIVGNLSASVGDALVRHEHTAVSLAELGLAEDIAARDLFIAAQSKQVEVLTDQAEIANAPFAPDANLRFTHALVYFQMAVEGAGEEEHDDAIDRLFERYRRLTPGRLYTVTENRVKVRQLPSI